MADKVFIRQLPVSAQVGILPWEKTATQTIVLDLVFTVDMQHIALSDSIEETVDYAALSQGIVSYLSTHRFNLIETLAERLAQFLLRHYHLNWLQLSVTKPKAIAQAEGVGVVIERRA